jgi:hypothetical protein
VGEVVDDDPRRDVLDVFVRAGFSRPARPRGTGWSAPSTLGSASQVAGSCAAAAAAASSRAL